MFRGNLGVPVALLAPFQERELLWQESPARLLQELSSGDHAARCRA